MKSVWKFALLNIVAVAGMVGAIFVLPSDTSAIPFFGISAIVIVFLNYSLAIFPRLRNQTGQEEVSQRAWKGFRSSAVMALAWGYLVTRGTFGLVLAAVTAMVLVVFGFAIWIAKKSAGPQ